MKLKKYMAGSLLALFALAACTNDSIVDTGIKETGEGILTLSMEGVALDTSKQAQTRAEQIATPEENEIQSMILLVYGLNVDGAGNYVETGGACKVFEYRKNWGTETPGTNVTKLELAQTGTVVTGKMDVTALTQSKMAVKAFVNGMGVQMDGSDVVLTAAEMAAVPFATQYEWKEYANEGTGWKVAWGTRTDVTTKIETPLPMQGDASIYHTGINNLDLRLYRQVARFDLRNGRTDLRIGSITPMQACTSVRGYTAEGRTDMAAASFLPTDVDPGMEWENVPAEVAPGFYTYPSSRDAEKQPMYFKIAAKVNIAGVWTDKTYKMFLQKDGADITVDYNTRYVINVQDITDDIITATIRIENWTEGETIDGGIDGDATDSKKVPTVVAAVADDAANGVTWTNDPLTGLPKQAAFTTVLSGKYIQFTTPVAKAVATRATGDDQPEVQVDIVSASGNQADVWLRHTSAVGTGANEGLIVHKLTVDVSGLANNTASVADMFVKVKNKALPKNYVMLTVPGSMTLLPVYNGNQAVSVGEGALVVDGSDVAAGEVANTQHSMTEGKNLCADGWSLPTKSDLIKLAGVTGTPPEYWPYETVTNPKFTEAFPVGTLYWSSTSVTADDGSEKGCYMVVQSGSKGVEVGFFDLAPARDNVIRCVKLAPPAYNGQESKKLDMGGSTIPCYVAPVNSDDDVQFKYANFATDGTGQCPEGWNIPTKDEIMKITGVTAEEWPVDVDASILKAYPAGTYWTRDRFDADRAWAFKVGMRGDVATVSIEKMNDLTGGSARCVQLK